MTRLARLTDAMVRDRHSELERIHPSVRAASAEELLAAGYGDTNRWKIPANWREVAGKDERRARRLSAARRKGAAKRAQGRRRQ